MWRNRHYSAPAASAGHDLRLSSAAAISSTNCGRRGPQREAMSSLSPKIAWSFTAGMDAQPARAATAAGLWSPSVASLSARKMTCGFAATM